MTRGGLIAEAAPDRDPVRVEEFGHGLGPPTGVLLLRYAVGEGLDLAEDRDDFLHQLYWAPEGLLVARRGAAAAYLGPRQALWVSRGVRHELRVRDARTFYRVCLREVPSGLEGWEAGVVAVPGDVGRAIRLLGHHVLPEQTWLDARGTVMTGLQPSTTLGTGSGRGRGAGYAREVARHLALDPADGTTLEEWAEQLHVSAKTLQRDFLREYGEPYSSWRSRLRLRAALVLLEAHPVGDVARRVGYTSTSAFVAAFARAHGDTPGRWARRRLRRDGG